MESYDHRQLVSLGDFNRNYMRIPRPSGVVRWDISSAYDHDELYLCDGRVWVVHDINTSGFVMAYERVFNDYDGNKVYFQGFGEDGHLYLLDTDIHMLEENVRNYTSINMEDYNSIWSFILL
jgi:hypothetical protein